MIAAAVLAAALAATPCAGRVELEGDRALVRGLGEELRGRGIESPGDPACPAHRARVVRGTKGISLTLADPEGRTVERTVRDPALIASWIESRLRTDLAEPLLSLPELPEKAERSAPPVEEPRSEEPARQEQVAMAEAEPAAGAAAAVVAEAEPAQTRGLLGLATRGELGLADGTTPEYGLAAIASLFVGLPVEPTLTLRVATSDRFETEGLSPARRRSGELLAGARLPMQLAFLRIEPGVGIGAGIDSTSRESCSGCGPVVEDGARIASTALRVEASLGAGAELAGGFSLELAFSAGASPFAGSDPLLPSWAAQGGEEAMRFALPAPPAWRMRAGLGLSWRAP